MSTSFSKMETAVTRNCSIDFCVNSLRAGLVEAIRGRMQAGDLSPSDVEKRSRQNITAAGVRKILKGESGILVETLVILADALETTAPDLLIEALGKSDQDVPAITQMRTARMAKKIDKLPPDVQKILEIQVNALSRAKLDTQDEISLRAAHGSVHMASPLYPPDGDIHRGEEPILPAKKSRRA